MPSLIKTIETVIKDNRPATFFTFETFLHGLSIIYGILARAKTAGFDRKVLPCRKLPCRVVSIGNITVGGTGKTPMTLYLSRLLVSLGYRIVVLSRGYKGAAEKKGGIVSDGKTLLLPLEEAGDEPYMMANTLKGVPIVVGRNRYKTGRRAIAAFSPDVILLDDGFQHIKLARDIDLVLVDHHSPFGNKHLLPRGPLREPISALKRADIIIETRCDARKEQGPELSETLHRLSSRAPIFQSGHIPHIERVISGKRHALPNSAASAHPYPLSLLQGKHVFAFSGLAENNNFHRTLTEIGCTLSGTKEFPDHYGYRESDFAAIQQSADKSRAELILTTQKDAVKIPDGVEWPLDLVVIGITPSLGDQTDAFKKYIKNKLLMGKRGVSPHASA